MMLSLLAAGPARAASVQELGSVLATLNDWRAMLIGAYAIIGVMVLLVTGLVVVIVRMATGRTANDQATLTALQANTKAMTELSASVRAVEMIAARRESEGAT
jgi:type II secretory pathway component PulM